MLWILSIAKRKRAEPFSCQKMFGRSFDECCTALASLIHLRSEKYFMARMSSKNDWNSFHLSNIYCHTKIRAEPNLVQLF